MPTIAAVKSGSTVQANQAQPVPGSSDAAFASVMAALGVPGQGTPAAAAPGDGAPKQAPVTTSGPSRTGDPDDMSDGPEDQATTPSTVGSSPAAGTTVASSGTIGAGGTAGGADASTATAGTVGAGGLGPNFPGLGLSPTGRAPASAWPPLAAAPSLLSAGPGAALSATTGPQAGGPPAEGASAGASPSSEAALNDLAAKLATIQLAVVASPSRTAPSTGPANQIGQGGTGTAVPAGPSPSPTGVAAVPPASAQPPVPDVELAGSAAPPVPAAPVSGPGASDTAASAARVSPADVQGTRASPAAPGPTASSGVSATSDDGPGAATESSTGARVSGLVDGPAASGLTPTPGTGPASGGQAGTTSGTPVGTTSGTQVGATSGTHVGATSPGQAADGHGATGAGRSSGAGAAPASPAASTVIGPSAANGAAPGTDRLIPDVHPTTPTIPQPGASGPPAPMAPVPAPAAVPATGRPSWFFATPGEASLAAEAKPEPVATQLATVLAPAARQPDGSYQVNIRLQPEELGLVHVELHLEGSTVNVSLHADGDATRDMLRQNLGQLRQQLASGGLTAGRFDVGSGPASDQGGAGTWREQATAPLDGPGYEGPTGAQTGEGGEAAVLSSQTNGLLDMRL